ncbi:SusC/RagA family TonB-linked outer membrane protein [Chitinophaga sp. GCM10012297]|uniref:SusC/RagA family TonB-linked outer membrane protein n=1 Tax=Chitinophaga chungangae TaxID=2821488 RepID=A0ABS3YKH3_9BACT|nr:SusC/RagA family TonB-linked outer membrane protein [Chitinophaga chungangae]MBO9155192.1 SusC/RagA family TonB-linked outer membrane protein [Chitinophaga chungangae]
MRLIFLLTVVATLESSASGWAQTVTLSVRNAPLEKVFLEMRRQTGRQFVFNSQMLDRAARVTLSVKNAPLEQALKLSLAGQPLTYAIVDSSVVIKPAPVTAIAATPDANAAIGVTGVVKSKDGTPLAGVSILVKGTNLGTVTDGNGRFELKNVAENSVLLFRFIGFAVKEIKLSNASANLNVVLEESENKMSEVVVTGYQNVDRKLFTGASSKVSAKDAERNGVPDISRMLEGQVAGVSVQNVSGTFGAAPKIRIRGATSLSGENKPLWVVDGIILEDVVNISNEALSTGDANTLIGSSVAGLNPDDIESFNILKDAAATAMYGARAMNGVIVVTTKRGRNTEGKPQVNYTGTFTTYLKPTYDQFDIMNSADQLSVLLELENKGWYNHSSVSRGAYGGIFYKMYNQMYEYDAVTDTYTLKNTTDDRLKFLERYAKANTDWFDLLFRNSLLQEHSLSVNSGSANSQTYFSTSMMKDNGMTLGDNVTRYTAKFRNNFRLSEKLRAEVLVNGSVRDQRTPGTLTRNSDPVYGVYSRDFDINPYSYALNTSRLMTPYDADGNEEYFVRNYAPFNIINELNTNYLTLKGIDLQVQGGIKYKIIPQLEYSVDGAYRYANTTREHYVLEGSNMAEAFRADYDATIAAGNINLYTDPDDINSLPVVVLPDGGFYNTTINSLKNFYFRQNLEYDNTFNKVHRFNFFGSMELRGTDRKNSAYEGIGYQYANGGLVNPNYRYFKKMIEGGDPYFMMNYGAERFAAFMGRAAYAFGEKYSVNATARYDGSNKMGKSKVARWLPTWNVSGAWHLDNEPFYGEGIKKVLSGATLRGTYGMTASIGDARNSSAVFYNRVTYRPYENEKESGVFLSGLENSELTWEKMYELNIGANLALFNKIDLTIDWYRRNSFDLIGSLNTSGIGGQFVKTANYADMKASGLEFTIAGNPVASRGFRWRTQFNIAMNKNEITNLDINPSIWTNARAEGGMRTGFAQRGLYSIPFAGLDPEYGYPTYKTLDDKSPVTTTYVRLQDEDKNYLVYHGPTDPTLTGGFYNSFSYKNFSLSTLLTFAAGNWIRLQPSFAASYSDMYTLSNRMNDRWLQSGDEKRTNIPSLLGVYHVVNGVTNGSTGAVVDGVYPYNAYNYSTEAVAKGDFIRLKRVALDYTLPARLISRIGLRSAQLSLVGNNIALLYSDKKLYGADPEFFNNGGVAMPIPKQYTLAVKVGL